MLGPSMPRRRASRMRVIQVRHDLADLVLGGDSRRRSRRSRASACAATASPATDGRGVLALEQALDPPVLVLAAAEALERFAGPRQVVELTALLCLADLPVDPGLVAGHVSSSGLAGGRSSVVVFVRARLPIRVWQAGRRGGLAAGAGRVIVIGLAAIVFGAFRDRRINERRRREMLAPPQRSIPKFSPDAPTPNYLSELQARRPPPDARPTELSPTETRRAAGCAMALGRDRGDRSAGTPPPIW